MNIVFSKTREQFPLSPKKIIKKTIGRAFAYIISPTMVYAIVAVVFGIVGLETFGWLKIIGLGIGTFIGAIVILVYTYERWYFATYFYELTSDFVIIRKGPITPREITIPYERIQDVWVDQDLLDRVFGLYDVHISSANFLSGLQAHIDGVEKQAADGLRALLLETVKKKIKGEKAEQQSA